MPARLPTVGGDTSSWGAVLNAFLSVAHNSDGSLTAFINVKDTTWGAKGDGVTDDAAAIQAAINASPVGSIIFFPGNHLIGSTIQLLAQRSYIGTLQNGASFFTFKQQNGANLPALLASYEWYNNQTFSGDPLRIEGMVLDCNRANNTTSHGIVLQNYYSLIREVEVLNAPGSGIVVSSVTRNGTSIVATNVLENRIESCKVQYTSSYGIYGHDANGLNTDCRIEQCDVSYCDDTSIYLERASGYFIHRNHLYGGKKAGIVANACWNTSIIGNEINGFGEGATSGFWQGISASCIGPEPTTVQGNIIQTMAEYNESTTYQYLVVTGAGVTDTNIVVSGNVIVGSWITTSATTSLVSGAKTPCAPLNMIGIVVGSVLNVGGEVITVASITTTTFTPTTNWVSNHGPGSYTVVSNKAASNSNGIVYTSSSGQQASLFPCTIISQGNRVADVGTYSFFDSYTTVGPAVIDGTVAVTPSTAATLTTGATIATLGIGQSIVTAAGAVTGIILQKGTQGGQVVYVTNRSAFTITFAAAGTSHVNDGASDVIAAGGGATYVWDAGFALWFRC